MNLQAAIITFSQSEKIKCGIIWISQSLEMLTGLSGIELQGAEKILKAMIGMIAHEISIARNLTKDPTWDDVEKHVDMAQVMVNSHVAHEAGFHLTKALTQVTSMGHRSLSVLKDEGML